MREALVPFAQFWIFHMLRYELAEKAEPGDTDIVLQEMHSGGSVVVLAQCFRQAVALLGTEADNEET
jgi:hypothetical protein